jgi:hypothetical protein
VMVAGSDGSMEAHVTSDTPKNEARVPRAAV